VKPELADPSVRFATPKMSGTHRARDLLTSYR
jgi:hypothetical protein